MAQRSMVELLMEAQRRSGEHPFAVLVWVDESGYPMHRPARFKVRGDTILLQATEGPLPPEDVSVAVIISRIRPLPQGGYEGRRYWTFHGPAQRVPGGLAVRPTRATGWQEDTLPFLALCERAIPQAQRYFAHLSRIHGRAIRPRLSPLWLLVRATRFPFLSATFVPVLLGAAVAFREGVFAPLPFVLALLGAACIHLGLNVVNDIFDTLSGADTMNPNPTPFSGGSRVLQYGLLTIREMAFLAATLYGCGILIGLLLAAMRGWGALLPLGIAGLLLSWAYTAPPLRLAYRGLGELAVAVGFGPIMTLGAYAAQTGRLGLAPLVASLPVAVLIALVLYVNEVPDREGDAAAGKRTLVVRLPLHRIAWGYGIAVATAYLAIAAGVAGGWMPPAALLAGLTLPMAIAVGRDLTRAPDRPYALIAAMATQIRLHLYVGLLLTVSYFIALWFPHNG
ncbi:prenyltransferase [Thermoflexus sp.]|uniref:prenyltransferase n=1 Tax=Thermoflexus sp. TaxID=1969742 RepID=UPI0035E4303B